MMDAKLLILEIEAAADDLGIATSTLGKNAGVGGLFYRRLKAGHRVWPDTSDKVRAWIHHERARRGIGQRMQH